MILTNEIIEMVASQFRVLSEPLRLQILQNLQSGELSVNQIVEATKASQPNISKHLRVMQQAGILLRRQEKNTVYYAVADDSIFTMCEIVCGSLKKQIEGRSKMLAAV